MFGKKCPNCNERIRKKFDFCPHCGINTGKFKNDKKDYGLLGKNDEVDDVENLFGEISGGPLNKMLVGAMKLLEKEMRNLGSMEREIKEENISKPKFQLFINGRRVSLPNAVQETKSRVVRTHKFPTPSEEIIEISKKLPRKEAECSLRRNGTRIIYELDVPGVYNPNQLLINKLERSIEIKAYSSKEVFQKTISISLPLIAYELSNERLFLEFQGK